MKTSFIIFFVLLALFPCSAQSSMDTDSIGIIKTVSGEVLVVGRQGRLSATPNMKIHQGDAIKTAETSSVGLIFDDDTAVSLGPDSEFAIESFLFNPVDQELSFVSRLIHGTFCFITGQIARLAPKRVKFETPEATLGVRGTKFLVKVE
ncbi:MAG: FecR domain-containing protein [Pseudomonadota bacterium]